MIINDALALTDRVGSSDVPLVNRIVDHMQLADARIAELEAERDRRLTRLINSVRQFLACEGVDTAQLTWCHHHREELIRAVERAESSPQAAAAGEGGG